MDGEAVMMDVNQGSYFAINEVGAHIWAQLETQQTVGALIESVRTSFSSDKAAQLEPEISQFLRDMADKKLVHEVSG
ncbi:PqqD family protein [Octadecabacter sp. G9-8]|uniref:PqqD family protein n=1 Tax=Octadecabacter dasysiphoniae TaxID=2909341 RepID=A0ABS9D156_9RHOB|nr:PqqD family protein [Octadecabacter dasysiphoniae]MCF2872354.1 PqqD family protein [Octadecabacter dasysiphoniae]